MATITKVQSKRGVTWRAQVRYRGNAQSKNFKRKTDAQAWASNIETTINKNESIPSRIDDSRTLSNLIKHYIDTDLHSGNSTKDAKKREALLTWWNDQIGNVKLVKLDGKKISEYRDILAKETIKGNKKRAGSTINRYLAALGVCLTAGVKKYHWINRNPMEQVSRKSEPKGRDRKLSKAEQTALLKACKKSRNPYLYLVVILALSTAVRRGEILSLKWSEVDFKKHRIILLDTKNGTSRSVPLYGPAFELMQEHSKVRRIDTPLVFPGISGDVTDFSESFENAVTNAKIENFRFHDLRHTAASNLAEQGATLLELADILGHKTLAMVKRYSHLTEGHTSELIQRMTAEVFKND